METGKQQRTKEKLLNLSLSILAKNPKASLNDIAEAADVGRATLFRHFNSRKQLIRELIDEAERRIEKTTQPILEQNLPAAETLEKIIRVLVPIGASFHFLSAEAIHVEGDGVDTIYNKQLVLMTDLSTRLKTEGVIAPDIPRAWVAAVLDNLIYTAWVTISDGDIAPNQAPELVLTSFLRGLSPR
jgi:AcrR family transcriptional regulator